MDWSKTAERLERYYAGDLSRSEEEQLRKEMGHPDLPEEWYPERDYILGVGELSKQVGLSDGFEKEFNAMIRAEETGRNKHRFYWVGAAASVVLAISLVFWPYAESEQSKNLQSLQVDDWAAAEKAVVETQKSLALLDDQLEGGMTALKYLGAFSAPKEVNHLKKIDQVKQDLAK